MTRIRIVLGVLAIGSLFLGGVSLAAVIRHHPPAIVLASP